MCVGENLLLTFLKILSLPRIIFVKLWAVHLYTVVERENGTRKKNTAFFSSLLQHKDQIKCYFKIQTTFSLFSPETKSDNENRDKTIILMIVDLIFLLLFQCSNCFPFSIESVFTPAVLPLGILRRQVSSPATDSTKIIWKPVRSMVFPWRDAVQATSVESQGNDKEAACSTKDNYLYILVLYMHSHMRIRSILCYSPIVMPKKKDTYIKSSRIWLSLLTVEIKKETLIAYVQIVRIQNVLAIVKY